MCNFNIECKGAKQSDVCRDGYRLDELTSNIPSLIDVELCIMITVIHHVTLQLQMLLIVVIINTECPICYTARDECFQANILTETKTTYDMIYTYKDKLLMGLVSASQKHLFGFCFTNKTNSCQKRVLHAHFFLLCFYLIRWRKVELLQFVCFTQ